MILKIFKYFSIGSLLLVLSMSCNRTNTKRELPLVKVLIPSDWDLSRAYEYRTDFYLLYYFDANCSLCFGKLIQLKGMLDKKNLENTGLILIGRTKDSYLIDYHLSKFEIEDKVLIDDKDEFLVLNDQSLILNDILLLDKDLRILKKGDPIDELNEFKRIINIK